MEERYNEVNNIEFECPPLNVVTTQTNVKIVLLNILLIIFMPKKTLKFFFCKFIKRNKINDYIRNTYKGKESYHFKIIK